MTLYSLGGTSPTLPGSQKFWIAPDANVVGDVRIGDQVSIWFGATVRGDNEPIFIGDRSNVQENSVLHTDMGFPLTIGPDCTVGHKAILHGCTIGCSTLIGMGATLLNGAVVGENSVVGACSLITEGKTFPDQSLIVGTPARVVRQLSDDEVQRFRAAATHYQENISRYINGLERIFVDSA